MPLNFQKRVVIPVLCASQLMLLSAVHADEGPTAASDASAPVKIVKAVATSPTTYQITLNQKLKSFQPADFQLQSGWGIGIA